MWQKMKFTCEVNLYWTLNLDAIIIEKGRYAMDLVHPYRLVFEKKENQIQLVKITSIEDYH